MVFFVSFILGKFQLFGISEQLYSVWGGSADIAWGWCNICTGVVQILHPYNKFIIKYILKEKKYSKEKKGQAWGLPLSLLLG